MRRSAAALGLVVLAASCTSLEGLTNDGDAGAPDGGGESGGPADSAADTSPPGDDAGDAGDDAADARAGDADADAGPAGIRFVQVAAAGFGAASSGKITLPNPVGAHHALVIAAAFDVTGVTQTITDTLGSTFVNGPYAGCPADQSARCRISYAFDTAAGTDTVTYNVSMPSASFLWVYVHEYEGIVAYDIGNAFAGTSFGTDSMTSDSAPAAVPGELVFGFGMVEGSTATAGTGFTARSTMGGNVTEDKILPATATSFTATASMASAGSWAMFSAGFKPQ